MRPTPHTQGVTCLGHAHPAITAAVTSQISKISHSQVNIAHSLSQLQLIEKLIPVMPSAELDTFFFTNSGSEAVEVRRGGGRDSVDEWRSVGLIQPDGCGG